jgi:hypothetical protein
VVKQRVSKGNLQEEQEQALERKGLKRIKIVQGKDLYNQLVSQHLL